MGLAEENARLIARLADREAELDLARDTLQAHCTAAWGTNDGRSLTRLIEVVGEQSLSDQAKILQKDTRIDTLVRNSEWNVIAQIGTPGSNGPYEFLDAGAVEPLPIGYRRRQGTWYNSAGEFDDPTILTYTHWRRVRLPGDV